MTGLAAVGLVAAGVGVAVGMASGSAAASDPIRIMPLGDSITGSPGCWRALLWQSLQAGGYTNIDMVGTLPAQGCGIEHDGDNEGHGGELVTTIADQGLLPARLSATNPDIVMMHLGTNDVWSATSTAAILAAYTALVSQMRDNNPNMQILVAQIIPVAPATCAQCPQRTIDLNAAIPGWAASLSTSASPIAVVDQWTGWDAAADTYDGVHPGDSGIIKMAAKWYAPLTAAIDVVAGSSPAGTSTPTPVPTPVVTPTAGTTACTAAYSVASQWTDGFVANVTVTAGSVAVTGWTVTVALPSGAVVTNTWSAKLTGTSGGVTASNVSSNGSLAAGQSTAFGFQGTGVGAGATVTCTAS